MRLRDWRIPTLAVAALAFALPTGGQLPYYCFYALAAATAFAWLWVRITARNVSCAYRAERRALAVGEAVSVRLRLYNEGLLPVSWLECNDASPLRPPAEASWRAALPGLGSAVRVETVRVRRRGVYPLGPLKLRVSDPFGIFEGRRTIAGSQPLIVYPRVQPLDYLPLPLNLPLGSVRTRRSSPEDFSSLAGVRPWRAGDNPRRVHWKTSARRGRLHVREFELAATADVHIFLDLAAGVYGPDEDERAVEIAASVARYALDRYLNVGFLAHGGRRYFLPPGKGRRAFRELLELLALAVPEGKLPASRALLFEAAGFSPRAAVVVITPQLTPDLAGALLRLRQAGLGVLLIHLLPSITATSPPGGYAPAAANTPPAAADLLPGLRRHGVTALSVRDVDELSRPGGEHRWRPSPSG